MMHVFPLGDLRDHVVDDEEECWCHPTDDEGVMVHHALDQRELYESGELLLQ